MTLNYIHHRAPVGFYSFSYLQLSATVLLKGGGGTGRPTREKHLHCAPVPWTRPLFASSAFPSACILGTISSHTTSAPPVPCQASIKYFLKPSSWISIWSAAGTDATAGSCGSVYPSKVTIKRETTNVSRPWWHPVFCVHRLHVHVGNSPCHVHLLARGGILTIDIK